MSAADPLIALIREWLEKAENDLFAAAQLLAAGARCPTDTVCFHAQQCVEKYIKALLVFRATPFSKTHNIHDLRALLPSRLRPKLDRAVQDRFTEFAVFTRYPGAGKAITLAEARKAVAIARRVRKEIRRHLPRAALRKKKP
jgi:HEPN domain-containing protein